MHPFFFYVGVALTSIAMVSCINLIGNLMTYVEAHQFSLVAISAFYFWIIGNRYAASKYYHLEFRRASGILISWSVESP